MLKIELQLAPAKVQRPETETIVCHCGLVFLRSGANLRLSKTIGNNRFGWEFHSTWTKQGNQTLKRSFLSKRQKAVGEVRIWKSPWDVSSQRCPVVEPGCWLNGPSSFSTDTMWACFFEGHLVFTRLVFLGMLSRETNRTPLILGNACPMSSPDHPVESCSTSARLAPSREAVVSWTSADSPATPNPKPTRPTQSR